MTLGEGASASVPSVKRPGVLLIGNFLSAQVGASSVGEELAARLRAACWSVITASSGARRVERLFDMLNTVWARRHEYDVAAVEVFSGPAFVWAEAVCTTLRLLRKPFVLTLHGGNLPAFSRRWPRRVRRLLNSAAAVTVPSAYLAREMSPYRPDMRLLPNPIDLTLYQYTRRERVRPMLVWLRAFHGQYRPWLAPEVVASLAPDFPSVELCMIGRDKGDGSLEQTVTAAESLGVTERLRLTGGVPKSEVPLRLAQADIFINTTDFDNTPVNVLEAMASGLCIASTNVGGIPDLLRDGIDALLVPPGDAAAMAAAVRRILTEPGLSGRLSAAARGTVEAFDWDMILPQWETLLETVSSGRA